MRMGMTALLVLASLAACRRPEGYRTTREVGDPQIVALSVKTQPAGATVQVNKIEKTWTTPCDVADFSIGRGMIDVVISLEGYETVATRVPYDGEHPATLKLKLRAGPAGAAAKAPPVEPQPAVEKPIIVKAPEPAPAVKAPEPAPAVVDPPVKVEPVAGGTRVRVNTPNAKVRIQAKAVVSEPDRPGELFIPDAPAGKVVIELLDPKTEALIASVEFERSAAPVVGVKPPPVAPRDPVTPEDRVGEVKLVSKTFGVFVKLDPGLSLQPGEEIIVFRDGREIARTKILKITKADDNYPDGAAQVQKEGAIQKGDEVRRTKP
jgi:hypothetical protein